MLELRGVKNIIFDLGGVILNVDYNLCVLAFRELGYNDFDALFNKAKQSGLFDELEVGKINEAEFVAEMQRIAGGHISHEQIVEAWNAMLLNLPNERLELLMNLKNQYNTYLLSNTNAIHEDGFTKIIQEENGIDSLDDYFHKVYFSHNVGLRKPHAEVFQHILDEHGLKAGETLFIDDSIQHVEGASRLGIKAVHLDLSKHTLLDLF